MSTVRPEACYAASLDGFCDAVLSMEAAVAPYSNNYLGNHARALGHVYPRVLARLGPETFAALSRVYAQHYPALEWDLNVYGAQFADLLAAQVLGARGAEFSWRALADEARSEYRQAKAYHRSLSASGL